MIANRVHSLSSLTYTITELYALEYAPDYGVFADLCKIDDTHVMLFYSGNFLPTLATFSVAEDGTITPIDSLMIYTDGSGYAKIVQIDATHYFVAFNDDYGHGRAGVYSIDANCDNITALSTIEHNHGAITAPSLVKIDQSHFILAFTEPNYGHIKTFSIDGSYNITQIDDVIHINDFAPSNSLVQIDATHYILAYAAGDGHAGNITTFSIDGAFKITELYTLVHEVPSANRSYYVSLVKIDSTHYMLAMSDVNFDGWLKVFTIDGSYDISLTSTLEHETSDARFNSLCKIDAIHYMLAYQGVDGDGFIKAFGIDGSFVITELDSLEHDTVDCMYDNSLIQITPTHFVLAYTSTGSDGFIKTFEIT